MRFHCASRLSPCSFIDFLLSPLADDSEIFNFRTPQELCPLSLWRAYQVMTTVGSGTVAFIEDPKATAGWQIVFENTIPRNKLRDKREQRLVENFLKEQGFFATTFLNVIAQQKAIRNAFGFLKAPGSFEKRLADAHKKGK